MKLSQGPTNSKLGNPGPLVLQNPESERSESQLLC
jgi:hypothetical protein